MALNSLSVAQAHDLLALAGQRAGSGATSVIEVARDLFKFAEVLTGKEAAKDAYVAYATAFNAADTERTKQIDLSNEKSIKAQVSKFNVFIRLGAVERTQRHDFIDHALSVWDHAGDFKGKPSKYDALLRASRAQIEAGARLDGEAIAEAMFPLKDAPSRVSGLEALATNLAKHIEKWAQDAIPGSHALQALDHLVSALKDAKGDALN